MSSNPPFVRLGRALLAGLLALVLLPPVARAATTVEVRIGAALDPAMVTVEPGTTVTWVNDDTERHRVRSTTGTVEFDSGNLDRGERFSHTFTAAGTTDYIDDRNREDPAYHGTVVVTTSAAPDPDPDPGTAPGGSTGPTTHEVSMRGRRFTPTRLEVTTGDTVRFLNDDDRDHTATADDGSFDSRILAAGQDFTRTFTRAGTFSYLCLLHPDMVGTIAVAAPGGTAPPPQPAPAPAAAPAPAPAPAPSSSTTEPAADGGTAAVRRTVQLQDFVFAPAAVEVPAGSTIVFTNTGRALHTATADDGSFDSDLVSPGGSFEARFDQPGTFSYLCLLHPEMVGRITVTGTGAGGGTSGAAVTTTSGTSAIGGPARPAPPGEVIAGRGADDAAPDAAAVSMVDDAFLPALLEVTVGDEVVWTNDGAAVHTVTADDGAFDSGLVAPGARFTATFDEPGTIAYSCIVHPGMTGEVRVLSLAEDGGGVLDGVGATDDAGSGLSTATLQLLMLLAFAVALAAFTAIARRVGDLDGEHVH